MSDTTGIASVASVKAVLPLAEGHDTPPSPTPPSPTPPSPKRVVGGMGNSLEDVAANKEHDEKKVTCCSKELRPARRI